MEELKVPRPSECQANHGWFKSDRFEFAITLSNGAPARMVSNLYYQGSFRNKTLLFAVHGGTYNRKYWNVPALNNRLYSFSCFMARQGYAVLAIDELGTGESSGQGSVDGDFITPVEAARALGLVMGQLRQRNNPTRERFEKIVLIGHSLGSEVALRLQADSHPADALVLTGWSHIPPPNGIPVDPAVLAQLAANPYIVTPPPLRAVQFFGPTADPAMIAYDAANLADVMPRGLFLAGFSIVYNPMLTGALSVTGKVLVQMGENDILFPAFPGAAATEQGMYPNAQTTVHALPAIGHCFNLHPENQHSWTLMDSWLRQHRCDRP